jgi:hypothetical protein
MSHRVITLEVKNHYSGESKTFQVSNIDDINSIADAMGPQILSVIHGVKDVRAAVDRVAKYLSNHHMSVDIQDPWDDEEILPSSETKDEKPEDPKSSLDWKSFLEQNDKDENVNIADQHIYDSASQRGPSYYKNLKMAKSEVLEKDRGRITFPADPKITNRPDQEVDIIGDRHQKLKESIIRHKISSAIKNQGLDVSNPHIKSALDHIPKNQASESALTSRTKDEAPVSFVNSTVPTVNESLKPHIEHEGFHNLISNIKNKHGDDISNSFIDHLYSHISPEISSLIGSWISNKRGYPTIEENPHLHKEEVISHLRDLTSIPNDRKSFNEYHSTPPNKIYNQQTAIGKDWNNVLASMGKFEIPMQKSETDKKIVEIFEYVLSQINSALIQRKDIIAKSEVLEKDKGRVTFPADPKITNRPDQNVRRVSSKNDPKTTDKLFQMRFPPEGKDEAVGIGRRAKENPTFGASIANLTTTSKLNPMAVAHNTNDAVAEHEGAHNLFANIGKKYGQEHLKGFLDHLVQGIDEDSFNNASEYLMGIPYYRAQYSRGARGNLAMMNNYKQEIINHIRDSVSKHPAQYDSVKGRTIKIKDAEDTSQRAFHKKIHGDNFNEFDNKLKQSWKNIKDLAESYSLTKNEEDSYYIMMQTMDINPLINLNQDEDSE